MDKPFCAWYNSGKDYVEVGRLMDKKWLYPLVAVIGGVLGGLLRVGQLQTGFDARTGLSIPGNGFATGLVLLFVASIICLLALGKKGVKKEQVQLAQGFAPTASMQMLMVAGAFLIIVGGAIFCKLAYGISQLHLVTGLLLIAGGVALLEIITAGKRYKEVDGTFALVGVMAVVVMLIVSYREVSINPVLWAYCTEILAIAAVLMALFQLVGFAFAMGNPRAFCIWAALAVILCCTTVVDEHHWGYRFFFLGSASLLLGFLLACCAKMPAAGTRVRETR